MHEICAQDITNTQHILLLCIHHRSVNHVDDSDTKSSTQSYVDPGFCSTSAAIFSIAERVIDKTMNGADLGSVNMFFVAHNYSSCALGVF